MPGWSPEKVSSTQGHNVAPRRKRKTLACSNCRRQKLRCDRVSPICGRCLAGGSAGSCMYETALPKSDQRRPYAQAPRTSGEKTGHTEHASRNTSGSQLSRTASHTTRILGSSTLAGSAAPPDPTSHIEQSRSSTPETLENRQPSASRRGYGKTGSVLRANSQLSTESKVTPPSQADPMIFRGKLYATEYYGATHPISVIARFPELHRFMVDAISQHTSPAQVQRSLKSLQLQWKYAKPTSGELGRVNLSHLLELLPDQQTANSLIHTYWTTFEKVYRILYAPEFWADYQLLWDRPMAVSADFVVILLLAMASVSCVSPQDRPRYMGDSSSPRETATAWIEVCESWLELQSRKNISLSYWQIQCLLVLAKLSNTMKKKRSWSSAGALMKLAMSAGFHRDPDLLRRPTSQLHKELRRRLWATMLELELQVSIDRGMASSAVDMLWDTTNVLNVDDDDLKEGESQTQQLPSSSYTPSSFLHISRQSLGLRSSLNRLINNSEADITHESVLKYDEQLTSSIERVKFLTQTDSRGEFAALPLALLDIQLRQFLILLDAPFAIKADSSARYSSSRLACFNAALAILDVYSKLSNVDRNTLSLIRNDTFRSALATCHVIVVSRNLTNEMLLQRLGNGLHHYIEAALERLGDKITLLGTGYTHYWYLSAAYGLVQSRKTSAEVQEEQKAAVDRVIKQYYKVLASQEDVTTSKAISVYRQHYGLNNKIPVSMGQAEESLLGGMSASSLQMPQSSFDLEPPDPQLDDFFFGDPAAWTFDKLW